MGETDTDFFEALELREQPRQERSRRTVLAILDNARGIVASEGVEALTTQRVAELCALPIGTVYRYFGDRNELLRALVARERFDMDALLIERLKSVDLLSWRASVRSIIGDLARFTRVRPGHLELRALAAEARAKQRAEAWRRWVSGVADVPAANAIRLSPEVLSLHSGVVVGAIQGLLPQMYTATEDALPMLVEEASQLVIAYLENVARRLGLDWVLAVAPGEEGTPSDDGSPAKKDTGAARKKRERS
ncbi:MAG: TetR/AcrR family transcriptional regulator [Polyangiaceae bacterium]